MRLAISGVPGTGKSTLCKLIAEHTKLELIPEIEDVVIKEIGYNNGLELYNAKKDDGMIEWFFISLDRKIKEETEKDNYVTDKCLLDCGARWFARMWQGVTDEHHDRVREAMKKMVEEKFYDKIIYLPLHLNRQVHDDGVRTTDLNLRYQRSLILKGLFYEYKVDFTSYEFKFSDPPDKVINELGLNEFKNTSITIENG